MEKKFNNLILVPTDFSEICDNAIDHGAEIATSLGYGLELLHVESRENQEIRQKAKGKRQKEEGKSNPPSLKLRRVKKDEGKSGEVHTCESNHIDSAQVGLDKDSPEAKINAIAKSFSNKYCINVNTKIRYGNIYDLIPETAEEIGANLVVLGSHGKHGLQHVFGSRALRLIIKSPVPSIVVRKRPFGEGYRNILFPVTDFTEARQKIRWAVHISKVFSSTIHIIKQKESDPGLSAKVDITCEQVEEAFNKTGVQYQLHTAGKKRHLSAQVVEFADHIGADLIMIMTEPDIYSPDFNLGPWDEKIMFNPSDIPVMCINPVEMGNILKDYLTLI